MDNALVVGELQRVANLRHDGQRLARGNAAAREQLPQVHAVHEFHEEEINWRSSRRESALTRLGACGFSLSRLTSAATEFVKRHDAGMI